MFSSFALRTNISTRLFTVRRTKVLILKDHTNLGLQGEFTFVKPSYAMNYLVPKKMALIATDPRLSDVYSTIDQDELKTKQEN
jgi:ribosomal protein L9